MSLSPKIKLALKVLIGLYVAMVVGFVITAGLHKHPADRDQIIQDLAGVAEKHDKELAGQDVEAMYDRFFAKKGDVFGLNYTFVMQILNFTILLLLLYGFLWQPVIAFLDQRRDEIRNEIESARQGNEEARGALAEYQKKLLDARAERQGLVEDGKREGRQERDAIIAQARGQAEHIVEDAQREIAAEVVRARDELRREVSSIPVQVARHILEREIQPVDHEAMIEDLVKEIESADLTV